MSKTPDRLRLSASEQPAALRVAINGRSVGTLANAPDNLVAFEYSSEWLADGYSISPLSLPLQKRVFIPKYLPFEGLFGAFEDSLPDGWGKLLVDRMLMQQGFDPQTVQPLTRLAIVGNSGMGALTYEPQIEWEQERQHLDLDTLADECAKILKTEYSDNLDELFALGGSSGGARPKILTSYKGDDWIVKFATSAEGADAGAREYQYALAAKECGIVMPEVKLFASKTTPGYFGVKRFDRYCDAQGNVRRMHYVSAGALLETSHRIPSLDYAVLMQLTLKLTNSYEELEKLYRLMCFNVFAHNRDDHAKNFAFVYDDSIASWQLSPAYDLTYNVGMGGEHATTVNGKGRDITTDDLIGLGAKFGLAKTACRTIAEVIQEVAHSLIVER
jgi:serine/threonine-protein kinase HipA